MTEPAGSVLEVSLTVDGEAAEAISALFDRHAGGAVVETRPGPDGRPEEHVVRAYIGAQDVDARARIEVGLWHLAQIYPIPEAEVRRLAEANWAEAWKADYRPLRIGRRFLVTPGWIDPEAEETDLVIRIDPGMAFGTGLHPSTQLCLEGLEDAMSSGDSVLDVGTGSGILSVGAALLGAGRVVAVDIDPVAVDSARDNAARSGVAIEALRGELDVAVGEVFDVVVANLLAPTIVDLAQRLHGVTRPGGTIIVSGVLDEQADGVISALLDAGFTSPTVASRRDWVAISAKRGGESGRGR